jgi:hypothetical protein
VFVAKPREPSGPNIFWLDERGELSGAARRLFKIIRTLDDGRFTRIHFERVRGGGLADAINDRLERAAGKTTSARFRAGP